MATGNCRARWAGAVGDTRLLAQVISGLPTGTVNNRTLYFKSARCCACWLSTNPSDASRYKAKSTEMFTDLFVLDQCRYYFDWFPTIPQAPDVSVRTRSRFLLAVCWIASGLRIACRTRIRFGVPASPASPRSRVRPSIRFQNGRTGSSEVFGIALLVTHYGAQGTSLRSAGVETSSMCRNAGAIFSI